jgi:superfamily II DNA or RNA helicase
MIKLEDLKTDIKLTGVIPGEAISVVDVRWHGSSAVELFYKHADGQPGTQLLYRHDEEKLKIVDVKKIWNFNTNGNLFSLAAEAYRIHLAHLFDPVLAVHTSLIEPLPHQITAVYGEMLERHPLRFMLADDPGSGKTIMAGLLIKELIVRGDVQRCLICAPGGLAAQWQDELWFKFQMRFEIMNRDMVENAISGNPFLEKDNLIIRLDQIARNDELKEKISQTEWDLIVIDEAHKMSAHFWGQELQETKRFKLGKLLREISRHFLLMTATPHNGKEEDFQLFMSLLDEDRFEGRFREGVHQIDTSDLMRRMSKEELVYFDGRPLFPERRAYTVDYPLSPEEAELYASVSEYVKEEFNRAEKLGDDKRKGTVGFALTILQRRLASSPEAIYKSLVRRQKRLEKRISQVEHFQQKMDELETNTFYYDEEQIRDFEDAPAEEIEELEEQIIDSATASLTIVELQAEIDTLKSLARRAYQVRHSGTDRKWEEMASIIQDDKRMIDGQGQRRKMVIFTEHRDTLTYLQERISTLFGREEMIVHIDGTVPREKRRAIEDSFRNNPDVYFLLATDAAGEGINLQRAHLMINYDLPWNPNRLEQRFGRIHRIGQREVCHLWNLVAGETREGYVYQRLLKKLEVEGKALEGKVFDVLGSLFTEEPLRNLLVEAIRYGDLPEVRAKLEKAVDNAVDQEHVRDLLEARSLAMDSMDTRQVARVREDMERYAARRLQPYYIKHFFTRAFEDLGGSLAERELGRYRINYVPARIRQHAKKLGTTIPVLEKYDRVCFEKDLIYQSGSPEAAFICPGHPLLDTVIDLVMEKYGDLLRAGSVFVDTTDPGKDARALFFLEQNIQDARGKQKSKQGPVSQEVHFVEIDKDGQVRDGGSAPYLDYRPIEKTELDKIQASLNVDWLQGDDLEAKVRDYAIEKLVPEHLKRIQKGRTERIDKIKAAVHERLTKEINYWDGQVNRFRKDLKRGKKNAKVNMKRAEQRAADMVARLENRMKELESERQISATPPVVVGGAIIVPIGLVLGKRTPTEIMDTRITEQIAMQAVMQAEADLDNYPRDVSQEKIGYDIESFDPKTGRLRFIEVKGRKAGADTITVYHTEILNALNAKEQFILALVEIENAKAAEPRYVLNPFTSEPDSGAVSVNYKLKELLTRSTTPI